LHPGAARDVTIATIEKIFPAPALAWSSRPSRPARVGDATRSLGRPLRTQGPDLDDNVQVPDEIDVERARRILNAIRERLGERFRPRFELDYLERRLQRE
jgi:hypothetical protein